VNVATDRKRLEDALLAVEAEARSIALADMDVTYAALHAAINALDDLRDEIRARTQAAA
jgi:hypothetical protein